MVGTRSIAPLIERAGAVGAKVVLVGDTKQLPEIDAGGLLRALETRHPIVTLNENRRQQVSWERDALKDFRSKRVEEAIGKMRDGGRLVVGENADVVRQSMVDEWWDHHRNGRDVLMMAHRNVDVDDLNRRARAHVGAAHRLHGQELVVDGRPFQIGDTVVCLRNDHPRKIRNGTIGEIVTINHDDRSVLIDTTEGLRRLRHDYIAEGWMRHGYAVTVHKAQGRTCDHGLLLASDGVHHEMAYVGISRGRLSNRLFGVTTNPDERDIELERHGHGRIDRDADPLRIVIDSMSTSAAKDLAVTQRPDHDAGFEIEL